MAEYVETEEFAKLADYFHFAAGLKQVILNASYYTTIISIEEFLADLIWVEQETDARKHLIKGLARGIDGYIRAGLSLIYDECLEKNDYTQIIGKLSSLMSEYYPKVIAATG